MTLIPAITVAEMLGVAIIAIVSFAGGFIVGRRSQHDGDDIRLGIAVFITLIWAISVIATISVTDYQTSIWVHAIMGAICGYLFGVENPLTGGSNG